MLKALRDLRSVRVLVYHPHDRERDELVDQIKRIGCKVEALWPPETAIPSDADIVFMRFGQDAFTQAFLRTPASRQSRATLIAIVEFESPSVIEAIARAGVSAIVTKPIRPFGLLTSMVMAHAISQREKNVLDRVRKLEARLEGFRRLEKAKRILMTRKGYSEQEAYETIRSRAMTARVTMDVVCSTIISADEIGL